MDTIVDEAVRKTWQLDPSEFVITNGEWQEGLKKLVIEVGKELGFDGDFVDARLYKFLLYEEGSHFKVIHLLLSIV